MLFVAGLYLPTLGNSGTIGAFFTGGAFPKKLLAFASCFPKKFKIALPA
jgi:hypothetical protein